MYYHQECVIEKRGEYHTSVHVATNPTQSSVVVNCMQMNWSEHAVNQVCAVTHSVTLVAV